MVFPTSAELRTYLQDRLPAYMTPAHFVFLDAPPHTKRQLDRRALPDPDPAWNTFDNDLSRRKVKQNGQLRQFGPICSVLKRSACMTISLNWRSLTVCDAARLPLAAHLWLELPLNAVLDVRTIAGQAERIDTLQWATRVQIDSDDDREDFEI